MFRFESTSVREESWLICNPQSALEAPGWDSRRALPVSRRGSIDNLPSLRSENVYVRAIPDTMWVNVKLKRNAVHCHIAVPPRSPRR